MRNFFVNLPVRYITEDRSYLDLFLEKGIKPELGLDAISIDQFDVSWHQELAAIFKENGIVCAIHLPFHDLQPGSLDNLILKATRDRLKKSIDIAKIYEPKYLLGHTYFMPLYQTFFPLWLNRSKSTWKQVLDRWPGHPPLYLENVREQDPKPIYDLLSELAEYKVMFCLDIGHWFCYGSGSQVNNLSLWLQTIGDYLEHLHLHDNDGISDQHLGLGQGKIPWADLFQGIEFLDIYPGFTLEPHSVEGYEKSWSFIERNYSWFSRLGVRENDLIKSTS